MSSFERESQKIVIAGASSLLGAELKSLLEESRFAGWDIRLVDEVVVAGTLTEVGGEPTVILPVEEGSFDGARIIFFTGSPSFAELNREAGLRSGAVIFDFTGKIWSKDRGPNPYFPKLDEFWGTRTTPVTAGELYWIVSAACEAAASLSFGLRTVGLKKLSIVFFRSVSESGREGVEALERQTGHLLSMQSAGSSIFDAQVAFNTLEQFGPGSQRSLDAARAVLRGEIDECVMNQKAVMPSIQLVQVPTFYGMTFTAVADLDLGVANAEKSIRKTCAESGFLLPTDEMSSPSNVSVAGENGIHLGNPRPDPANSGTWWFWGAADNVRLPAWNAVKLAEKLVE